MVPPLISLYSIDVYVSTRVHIKRCYLRFNVPTRSMKCKVTYIKLCYFEKLIKPKEWQGINLSGTPTR